MYLYPPNFLRFIQTQGKKIVWYVECLQKGFYVSFTMRKYRIHSAEPDNNQTKIFMHLQLSLTQLQLLSKQKIKRFSYLVERKSGFFKK